jgi:sugar lactone lactonase YvrE
VYKLVKDKPKVVIKSKDLKGPNGVLADETSVWIVCFGANELYNVKTGKKTDVKALPKGSLDGIVRANDGKLLVSSWESNQVFRGSPDEDFMPVVSDVKSPADIGYDAKRNRVLVPLFTENSIVIQPL